MAVTCTWASKITCVETFSSTTSPLISASSDGLTHNGIDKSVTLNADSTPAVTDMAAVKVTLTAGAATVDLTSLTHNGASKSISGKKIKGIKFQNPSTNSGDMVIQAGASNGNLLLGSAFKFTLKPGEELQVYKADQATAVSGSLKTWDITGTGTESMYFELVCA